MKLVKRQDFITAIQLLDSRVSKLESGQITRDVTQLQHRRALSDAIDALEKGLTEPPLRKWSEAEKKAWNTHVAKCKKMDWSKGKEVPW